MKPTTIRLSALAGAIVCLTAFGGSASAEGIVDGMYRISLTDPATGAVFHVEQKSVRSWPNEAQCEEQIKSFSGVHTKMLKELEIMNAQGTPLTVKMDSMHCKVIRKE